MSINEKFPDTTFLKRFIKTQNTLSIDIEGCEYRLKEEDKIIEVKETKYNYRKVTLQLSPEGVEAFKRFEEAINLYLIEDERPEIKIVYGNRVYAKLEKSINENDIKGVLVRSIYVDSLTEVLHKYGWYSKWLKFNLN